MTDAVFHNVRMSINVQAGPLVGNWFGSRKKHIFLPSPSTENPHPHPRELGLVNDASASNTIISAWLKHDFGQDSKAWKPFWLAGIGFGITDIDEVRGDVSGGGTYDISTDGGTEIIPFVDAGLLHTFSKSLEAEFGIRAQYHIGGWDVKDRNSGLTGSVDDYLAY